MIAMTAIELYRTLPGSRRIMLKRIAIALRTLFPDPCNMDHRDAITRWETAVDQVQQPTNRIINKRQR
jgi:hypothetical protein